jgi:hypothetical protein
VLALTATLVGCGESDAITVDGKEQPRLWEPGVLTAAVRQLPT